MGSEEAARAAPRALGAPSGWEGGGGPAGAGEGEAGHPGVPGDPPRAPGRLGEGALRAEAWTHKTLQVARGPREARRHPARAHRGGPPRGAGSAQARRGRGACRSCGCTYGEAEAHPGTRCSLAKHVLRPTPRPGKAPAAPGGPPTRGSAPRRSRRHQPRQGAGERRSPGRGRTEALGPGYHLRTVLRFVWVFLKKLLFAPQ